MNSRGFVFTVFLCLLLFHSSARTLNAQVVAGSEVLTGAGGPDAWTNILYINEDNPFSFGGGQGVLTYSNFWVAPGRSSAGNGLYTPFVAEPLVENPLTGDDFVIRAIGTTREAGVDFTCDGEFRYPFHDTDTFVIQDGWLAGFMSSDPLGERADARSPIPFAGAGIEGWETGTGSAGTGAPAIEIGEPILEGGSGTDVDGFGFREYQFNISAVAGDTKPDLEPGGRVGDACAPPPEPEEGKIGAPFPLVNGTPDSWSGIPVLYGYQLPPGESVEVVRYYAADDREFDVQDEFYNVTPLIVRQEDGSVENGEGFFEVWEIGPNHKATEIGENEFSWGSSPIPDDGNLYHPAALQWMDDADDGAGGVIAFGDGGEGMHFFNVNTTDYIPDDELGEVEPGLVLSDLQTHSSGVGGRLYQLNFEMSGAGGEPGDFNNDGKLDELDINDLAMQVRDMGTDKKYDLNGDDLVNSEDHTVWVKDIKNTWFGDSDLNGEFNSGDFVVVFTEGLYETDQPAGWEAGDWDGDGVFNSSDFVIAFTDGGYEQGKRPPPAAAIPEPSSLLLMLIGLCGLFCVRRDGGGR